MLIKMANMHCQLIEKTVKCALVTKSRNRQISPCNVYTVFFLSKTSLLTCDIGTSARSVVGRDQAWSCKLALLPKEQLRS